MKLLRLCGTILILGFNIPAIAAEQNISDDDIREMMIRDSIASYPGNCPCPYNRASNGSRCGKRSAWSRAGGYAPLCYDADISIEIVEKFRKMGDLIVPKKN